MQGIPFQCNIVRYTRHSRVLLVSDAPRLVDLAPCWSPNTSCMLTPTCSLIARAARSLVKAGLVRCSLVAPPAAAGGLPSYGGAPTPWRLAFSSCDTSAT